jgi:hypothetical protein
MSDGVRKKPRKGLGAISVKERLEANFYDNGGRYVYIRIPKTGSQTTNSLVGQKWNHFSAAFAKKVLGDESWSKAFTFATCRNPWGRYVSYYYYYKTAGWERLRQEKYKVFGEMSFGEWLLSGCPSPFYCDMWKTVAPPDQSVQINWIVSDDGQVIVNRIFKIENLGVEKNDLIKLAGIDKNRKLLHTNASRRPSYKNEYNKEMIDYVAEREAGIIELMGYKF